MKYSYAIDKISKILRTKPKVLKNLCAQMEKTCKKSGVLDQVIAENDFKVKEILGILELKKNPTNEEVYRAIISKLEKDDQKLFEILKKPICTTKKNCGLLIETAIRLSNVGPGFYLKKHKACKILESHPPKRMLRALGYRNTKELLRKEDFREVFSALRFVESSDWMDSFLTYAMHGINPLDFEERKIEVLVLHGKWLDIAEKFIKKKYHNLSHLKELGIIFIIPLRTGAPGEIMRIFTLLLHYLHEVDFYSRLFRKYAKESKFLEKVKSALRGDILERKKLNRFSWRIVQRYLAKEDENDFRLFEPHVNPEAIHWDKAENDLSKLDAQHPDLNFTFWKDLDFVGDFFRVKKVEHLSRNFQVNKIIDGDGIMRNLVSFNLIDNVMSLVKEKEMIKYLYHHQESLWNKIFMSYVGKANLEKLIFENFDRGYITAEDIEKVVG